jgi:hypothetical protein
VVGGKVLCFGPLCLLRCLWRPASVREPLYYFHSGIPYCLHTSQLTLDKLYSHQNGSPDSQSNSLLKDPVITLAVLSRATTIMAESVLIIYSKSASDDHLRLQPANQSLGLP